MLVFMKPCHHLVMMKLILTVNLVNLLVVLQVRSPALKMHVLMEVILSSQAEDNQCYSA